MCACCTDVALCEAAYCQRQLFVSCFELNIETFVCHFSRAPASCYKTLLPQRTGPLRAKLGSSARPSVCGAPLLSCVRDSLLLCCPSQGAQRRIYSVTFFHAFLMRRGQRVQFYQRKNQVFQEYVSREQRLFNTCFILFQYTSMYNLILRKVFVRSCKKSQ